MEQPLTERYIGKKRIWNISKKITSEEMISKKEGTKNKNSAQD